MLSRPSSHTFAVCVLATLLPFLAHAQGSAANEDEVVDLTPVVVDSPPDEAGPAPLVGSSSAVFGDDRGILEIPRSVNFLDEDLLLERDIDKIEEILQYVPGAYAPARFGNVTVPNIRGDTAETYTNGQRRSGNVFGYKPSFNAVEAIDIVRGPATVVFGPGQQSGGYVNFDTKTPSFDTDRTILSGRLGTWVPDDANSYLNTRWQIDHNETVSDRFAIRISYEGQENDTLYKDSGARDDHQDIYVAMRWLLSEQTTFDLTGQYIWQASPQTLGVNRPSQALVDDGDYYSAPADPVTGLIGPGQLVDLDPENILFSDDDYSKAHVWFAQGVLTTELSPDAKIVNRTFADYVDRERFHEFEYIEYVEQLTIENRTEYHRDFSFLQRENTVITGAALRFEDREGYTNYFNEFAYLFDLSQGPNNYDASALPVYVPGVPGPDGRLFFTPPMGSPETVHSQVLSPAAFWQHEIELAPRWTALYGIRGDAYFAEVEDPLPQPGTPDWSDKHDYYSSSYNAALTYRPTNATTYYGSYTLTHAINGNTVGGGINLYGDGHMSEGDFRNRSKLYELGGRWSLLDEKLFLGLTGFWQERQRAELRSGKSDIIVRGIELESVYEPREDLQIFGNVAFQEANYDNSSPVEFGGSSLGNVYEVGAGPGGIGNGLGYIGGLLGDQPPPGDYRVPGVPRWLVNAGLAQRFENGWGGSLWGTFRSEQHGNVMGEYIIPSQYTLNASVSYEADKWTVGVEILNLTNEENFIHNGDTFFDNLLVSRELPRRVEAYFRYWF